MLSTIWKFPETLRKVLTRSTVRFWAKMYVESVLQFIKTTLSELTGINRNDIIQKSNNSELYFEEEDLDSFLKKLKEMNSIEYVHELKEQPWGQRVIRFYDPDMHIIEVGEPMESVVKRLLSEGLSVEETSKRTLMPEEFIRQFL